MHEVPHMEFMHDMCNMVKHIMLELPFYSKSQKLTDFVIYLRNDHKKFRIIDACRYCVRLVFLRSGSSMLVRSAARACVPSKSWQK